MTLDVFKGKRPNAVVRNTNHSKGRVKAALRLCHQLDRSKLFIQTSIDEITASLGQMSDTLDESCLQDLGLTEIEHQFTSVRDTINQLSNSLDKENFDVPNHR